MPQNFPTNRQNPNRKDESIRRANRVIQTRTFVLMLIMGIGMFFLLFFKLYNLQITRHEELQAKAVSQQTRSSVVTASRGAIYDASGNILAISSTAETIFLSPKEINDALNDEENPVAWTKEVLAAALAKILDVSEEGILKKMARTDSMYEVLKFRVEEDIADQVRQYINDNKVKGVYLTTDAKRYYPYGDLAAQVIGFVGVDYTGLFGLEAEYDKELQGQSGLVVTAKANQQNDLLYEYSQYFDPENGDELQVTLEATVQYYLEKGMKDMCDAYSPANGATGIVLDVRNGGILAMASFPNYDLNDYATVTDKTLLEQMERGELDEEGAQQKQWRNKALNDTYEPGSTFKILTLSAALEEGLIDKTTSVNCSGSVNISGHTIHCSNKAGHGLQTLEQTVGNSCNPAFMNIGLRIGNAKFYQYMKDFGLMEKTGIDTTGEASGFANKEIEYSTLALACYAFGQNFNVTPIALLAAQCACVNGGYLYTPYLVEEITDQDGNVVSKHDSTPIRQVVSEETSALVRDIMEYEVTSGTGKNGQVAGYRIGGKTGTADKVGGGVIVSFVCFAPADDPQVMMLLTLDEPSKWTGTYVSGGNMVAPVASSVMGEILPYLGIEPSYTAEELVGADKTVPNVVGLSKDAAAERLSANGFSFRTVGSGDTVTDQTPAGGAIVPNSAEIILYLGAEKSTDKCIVPNVVGDSAATANQKIVNAGLIMGVSGATNASSSTVRAISQSIAAGTEVEAGTVVRVQFSDSSVRD